MTKTFDSNTVTAGGSDETFTIEVTNSGVSDADNLHVTDSVDSRLIVDSTAGRLRLRAEPDARLHPPAPRGGRDGDADGHLPRRHDDRGRPDVPNTANAASDENTAAPSTDTVAIVEDVNLVVTKHFADDSVDAGTTGHTFTVTVQNTGVSQADNVSLTDTVDSRLIVTGVSAGDYTCPTATEPVDQLHAGAPGHGRHEGDHGHLPRRLLDAGGSVGLEHGELDRGRRRRGLGDRHGRDHDEGGRGGSEDRGVDGDRG